MLELDKSQICAILVVEMGRFLSGQKDQTVNLMRELRWFESTSPHQGPVVYRLVC